MKPEELKYSADHLWLAVRDGEATVGISDHAQKELADIVFIELPETGKQLKSGDLLSSIESMKSNSDLLSPVSGEIIEVNEALRDSPETINEEPYGKGWIVRIRIANPEELNDLLDFGAYQKHTEA
jgi:glycine cleavage system H protein